MSQRYRLVQPYGKDKTRDATIVSEHAAVAEAFAELNRIADVTLAIGTGTDYLELIIIDDERRIVTHTGAH